MSLISRTKLNNMNRLFIIIILLVGSAVTVSAQDTESRSLSDFSELSVGEAITLKLIPGNKNEAVLKVRNIDLEDVLTNVSGGRLKVELKGSHHGNIDVEIRLTYVTIDAISVSSAADVATEGPIKAASLDISVSSAGDADLDIIAEEIEVEVSSAGDLTLTGVIGSQRSSVSSAGDFDAYDLKCDDAYVRASSAGSARVSANKKIDAKASSGGSIRYKGNPDKVYVSSSSGGDVNHSN
jgi:hypothetical protein